MTAHADLLSLHIERRLPAPRDDVFAALTEPAMMRRWWGPAGFSTPSIEVDLRPGGGYRILMQPPEGQAFHLSGTYREVAPPGRLAYTFRWEEPDPDDRENVVTLALEEDGDGTRLVVDQAPFATDARLQLHRQGWSESLDRLGVALVGAG